jgi:hypothetical protein
LKVQVECFQDAVDSEGPRLGSEPTSAPSNTNK